MARLAIQKLETLFAYGFNVFAFAALAAWFSLNYLARRVSE